MLLPSRLLADTVQLVPDNQVLFLNSAADPFVSLVARQLTTGTIMLAEDNIRLAAEQRAREILDAARRDLELLAVDELLHHRR